ncbi:MAG: thiamine pyrophosphate-binding protein [Microbacteriaceae bacterium]|nr:thiamine pyrophosphate-binding protein [Microbacteriaceae bacterium]
MATPQASDRLLATLIAWGIRDVFICPGSTEAAFLDATVDFDGIKIWTATHEVTAVAMADGLSRSTGKPTAVFLHTSVGLANGVGGIYTAQIGQSPILIMSGLKSLAIQSRRGFTAPPRVSDLVHASVKWSWQSLEANEIANDAARALQVATTQPRGPVWLGLSEDLLAAPAPQAPFETSPDRRRLSDVQPAATEIARVARILVAATSPVLVAGNDVARDRASAQIMELSELLAAPVFHEDRRSFERSVIDTSAPAYAGLYSARHPLVEQADLIAFLGARCFHEFESRNSSAPPAGAKIVQSATDPAELGKTYGADAALAGNQLLVLQSLVDEVKRLAPEGRVLPRIEHLVPARTRLPGPDQSRMDVDDVARTIGEFVTKEVTVVVDATTSNAAMARIIPQRRVDQLLTTSSGNLGWGVGAALGVQVGQPEGRTICVLGDGSFQFGMQGLALASREKLTVLYVVVNNEAFAAVGAGLHRYGGRAVETNRYPGMDIKGPHIAQIAAGFGLESRRVWNAEELRAALAEFMTIGGPALIEVMTDPRDLGPA